MTLTASKFSNGGYVAHGVRVNVSPMRFSVWFSEHGDLLDCEAFDQANRSRPVSPKVRESLSTMFGRVVRLACDCP